VIDVEAKRSTKERGRFKAKYHGPCGDEIVTVFKCNVTVDGHSGTDAEVSAEEANVDCSTRFVPMRLLSSFTPIDEK
jgi:hypothetical protein